MKTPPDIHVAPDVSQTRDLDDEAEKMQHFLRVVTTVPFPLLTPGYRACLARMAQALRAGGADIEC